MPDIRADLIVDSSQLGGLRESWKELAACGLHCASYDLYRDTLASANAQMRVVLLRENGNIVTLAPFLLQETHKNYWIGARQLFRLPVRELKLVGSSFVGKITAAEIRDILALLYQIDEFDLISISEIEFDGTFHRSLRTGIPDTRWSWARGFYKNSLHWSIELPSTIEEYMAGLSARTRQSLRRKARKFEKNYKGALHVICSAADLERFLAVGESISRLTYQWNIGRRLCADEATRSTYSAAAKEGRLRCYLLYSGDYPCAFLRGVLHEGTYHYETPGFDPAYEKASPGTVLLLMAIEDLIANTDCKMFDFGRGGDETGYKSMFGNRSYEAISLELFRRGSAYPLLLLGIQAGLFALNRVGQTAVGPRLRSVVRHRLRKYGC